jgi:hypothetical protein
MPRVPRVILTVCLATVFFGGRCALGQEGSRTTTEVASVYTLASFADQPPNIPVAGADLEELTRNARVCLSFLNTLLRRIKKRPLNGAASASSDPVSAHICSENESKEIEFETRA